MSEVEKLYKNAGVKVPTVRLKIFKDENGEIYTQPPFSAEKQIKLIKWLIQKNFYDERIIRSNFEQTYFYRTYIDDYGDYCESEYFEKFEEVLANVVNYYWQDLTEEERKRIKDILQ